jgi:hypothetical protein
MVDSKDPKAKIDLYGLSKEELSLLLASWGFSAFHANVLWNYMYREKRIAFENMDRLRIDLIQELRKSTTLESVSPLASTRVEKLSVLARKLDVPWAVSSVPQAKWVLSGIFLSARLWLRLLKLAGISILWGTFCVMLS